MIKDDDDSHHMDQIACLEYQEALPERQYEDLEVWERGALLGLSQPEWEDTLKAEMEEWLGRVQQMTKESTPGAIYALYQTVIDAARLDIPITSKIIVQLLEKIPPREKPRNRIEVQILRSIQSGRLYKPDTVAGENPMRDEPLSFKASCEEWHANLQSTPNSELNEVERYCKHLDSFSCWEYLRDRKKRLSK
jgi:hypothetical protein